MQSPRRMKAELIDAGNDMSLPKWVKWMAKYELRWLRKTGQPVGLNAAIKKLQGCDGCQKKRPPRPRRQFAAIS